VTCEQLQIFDIDRSDQATAGDVGDRNDKRIDC
jgi:hypothetical protein